MKRQIIIIILLTTGIVFPAFSQNESSTKNAREIIREIVNEKLHDAGGVTGAFFPGYEKQIADSFSEIQISFAPESESEVHAAINPTDSNNIVMSAIQLILKTGYYKTQLPIYYTRDFGNTWNQSSFTPEFPDTNYIIRGGGDPVFAFDADGKLYFSWIHLYKKDSVSDTILWLMLWAYSMDGGENWLFAPDPFIENSAGTFPYNFDIVSDKEWLACDQSGSPYRNNLYVAYFLVDANNNTQQIVVKTKPAGSAAFNKKAVTVGGGGSNRIQFAGIDVDGQGIVHVTYFYNNNSLYECRSTDGGKTFSTPVMITYLHRPFNIRGIQSNRLYPSPMMAVDKSSSNNVYITYTADGTYTTGKTRSDIYFCRSEDGGDNWEEPIIVHDTSWSDPRDQFYSTIYVNNLGVITVCWYDAKLSSGISINNEVNYYMAHSFDHGKTFTFPTRVSYAPTDFGTVGYKNNSFGIGEYTQVVSANGYAVPFWTDGRSNDGNLNIYSAKIPISRFSELQEVEAITSHDEITSLFFNKSKNMLIAEVESRKGKQLTVDLVDMSGKPLETLFNGTLQKGRSKLFFPLKDTYSGIFLIRMRSGGHYMTRKTILTK